MEAYNFLLRSIMEKGTVVHNERTNRNLFVQYGMTFHVDVSDGHMPIPSNRRYYPGTAAAETAWFISGSRDVRDLQNLGPKIWDKFAEPDGSIPNAYGYRWRKHFNRDQLADAVKTLREDRSSRQVVVSTWDPAEDGLGRKARNFPCPAMFTLNADKGWLHSTMLMRSSDVFIGLPYDVMGHSLLVDAIAAEVGGLSPGRLTFVLADAHVYDIHWDMAEHSLWKSNPVPRVSFPRWDLTEIEKKPMDYVRDVLVNAEDVEWPEYSPKVEVVL